MLRVNTTNTDSRSKNESKGYSYSASSTSSLSSGCDSDRSSGYGRKNTPAASTEKSNKNSMYAIMREKADSIYSQDFLDLGPSNNVVAMGKTKKAAQQNPPRPVTPHSNKPKNFIEKNKIMSRKQKDDPVLPNHSTKQPYSQRSSANGQSSARNLARPSSPKPDKKRIIHPTGASSKVMSSSVRRPTSPPATSHAASHQATAHSRSHVRAESPDSSLREDNKRLKLIVAQQKEEIRMKEYLLEEKTREFHDLEDVVVSLREKNEKLKRMLEANKQASDNSTSGILSSIMSNRQRILDIQSDSTPTPTSLPSMIDTNNNNNNNNNPSTVARFPKTQTPAAAVTKNKVNYSVRNISPVASPVKPHVLSPKLTAQAPKRMERSGLSPLPVGRPAGPLDQRVKGNMVYSKRTAADLNVDMETDESEVDDVFGNDTDDDSSDNSTDEDSTENDSESTSTDDLEDNDEECDDEEEEEDDDDDEEEDDRQPWIPQGSSINPYNDGSARNHSQSVDNRDDGDDVDDFSRHDLNAIVEDEDEGSEFELDSSHQEILRQKKYSFKSGLAFNTSSITGRDSPKNHVQQRRLRRNHGNSTNSKTSTILNGQSVYSSTQNNQPHPNAKFSNISTKDSNSDVSSIPIKDYPHRDSLSSVASDSSEFTSFSKNGSYPSSATSPSSTRTNSEPCTPVSGQSSPSVNASPLVFSSSRISENVSDPTQNGLNSSSSAHQNGQAKNSNSTKTSYDNQHPTSNSYHAGQFLDLKRSTDQSNNLVSASHNYGNGYPDSITKSGKQLSGSTSVLNSSSQNLSTSRRTPSPVSSPNARPISPASSTQASTVRTQSPVSSSRSSESSRTRPHESSNYNDADSSSNVNFVQPPPPPPPSTKDPVATLLQHYLRLISSQCVQGKHCPQEIYDLRKVIDEGSSAKVYTARPMANRKEELAVKVVPLTYNLEFIFNEIYVLKNFKHKHIVDFKESLLRWDGKNREVWIAMEKCARGDVTSRAGKIGEKEVSRIAKELLEALKHIHSNGIIHRDIKLSNILAGANNEIKLADFGISSLTPTSTTSMVGTIPYMAPDVVTVSQERPYDTKVDIWSLGVCILELLSGKAAWGRIRDDEIMDRLRKGEMPCGFQRLIEKVEIGWEVKDFLEKCFAKNADDRWSAERLLEHQFITNNRF